MTAYEIQQLPAGEVYKRLAAILWPWDESRCRVCGCELITFGCTKDCCRMPNYTGRRADDRQLQSWDGVGRMLEAMIGNGFEPYMNYWPEDECEPSDGPLWEYGFMKLGQGRGHFDKLAWDACARAVLLALAESESNNT